MPSNTVRVNVTYRARRPVRSYPTEEFITPPVRRDLKTLLALTVGIVAITAVVLIALAVSGSFNEGSGISEAVIIDETQEPTPTLGILETPTPRPTRTPVPTRTLTPTPTSTPTPLPPPPPETVVYEVNQSTGFGDIGGECSWTISGDLVVNDGSNSDPNCFLEAMVDPTSLNMTNYSVEVVLKVVKWHSERCESDFGLAVRTDFRAIIGYLDQQWFVCRGAWGIAINYREGDGFYKRGEALKTTKEFPFKEFPFDGWNTYRFDVKDNQFTFYINDQERLSVSDLRSESQKIGLVSVNVQVEVSSIRIVAK